jgi:cytidine deaminase
MQMGQEKLLPPSRSFFPCAKCRQIKIEIKQSKSTLEVLNGSSNTNEVGRRVLVLLKQKINGDVLMKLSVLHVLFVKSVLQI